MDILTITGILLALFAILGGNVLEGGHMSSLVQLTAFVIVAGGTLGAVMVQTPIRTFVRAMKISSWVVFPVKLQPEEAAEKIVNWSNIARREGLLGLEAIAEEEPDEFARKGLQLLVDGSEPEVIRSILEVEIDSKEHQDTQAAKVFDGLGGYSPTIGIIGAVMGLIHVMNNLADPSKLGSGIATAFVATIYGVGFANLLFLPMANKLKSQVHAQSQFREMIVEGVISIAEGENPRNIETKLQGYYL
ncbi:chemotaxis protein MotA [Thiogranum longum]|uniref:Chemotaxis protein MotA n=1 Tax=Thiogranum longum TaxID=1537524 RepID=A0A4R1HNI0_9GAMM|nr:flagellar motor protein [Thiogranum longum]TCK18822.1 chemotaxis protein MotA [Thiogranum longum]